MSLPKDHDKPEIFLHGYDLTVPTSDNGSQGSEGTERDWIAEYAVSSLSVELSLRCRDIRSILARSASQCLIENVMAQRENPKVKLPTMELLQAMVLRQTSTPPVVPPSPNTLVRLWSTSDDMLQSFMQKQKPTKSTNRDAYAEIGFRGKVHTLNYRFSYDRDACLQIIGQVAGTPDITSLCRQMAIQAGGESEFDGITDCVVITLMKRSSTRTYDGVSFFRFLPRTFQRPGPTF